jgi:hypothetical protein
MPLPRYIAPLVFMLGAAVPPTGATAQSPAEQEVLQAVAPLASRQGAMLTLKIAGNKRVQLRSKNGCDEGPDDCLIYELLGLSPDRRFFIVEMRAYESVTQVWIARASGKRVDVYAETHVSPDGTRIVTANPSEYGSTNGVFLWDVSERGLTERFRFEPDQYALYSFVRWRDRDSVDLMKVAHADATLCPASQLMESAAQLVRVGGKWVLRDRIDRQAVSCQ